MKSEIKVWKRDNEFCHSFPRLPVHRMLNNQSSIWRSVMVKGKRKGIAWHISRVEGRVCECVYVFTHIWVCARIHTNAIGRSITYPWAPAVTEVVQKLSRTRCELASSDFMSAEASWSSAVMSRLTWPWLPRGNWLRASPSDFPPSTQAQNSSTRHRSPSKRALVHCAASPLAAVLRGGASVVGSERFESVSLPFCARFWNYEAGGLFKEMLRGLLVLNF